MGDRIRLLIIDDDVEQCKTLKNILDKKGYETFVASSSQAAIAFVRKEKVDLIFIDLILKGDKNGVEIFKEIKSIAPGTKAILFTGYGPEEERKLLMKAAEEGMIDEILRKPVWPEEMIKAIEKHTGGKKDV
ncbi:MAG: response regulator [Candidatus Omnitrophica bacterium]|nr:response regulator [Candidatus Omnitrophota bacterium]